LAAARDSQFLWQRSTFNSDTHRQQALNFQLSTRISLHYARGAMNAAIRLKLFVMMVLEFFIWGAWLPMIFDYLPSLGFSASEPPHAIAGLIPAGLPWWLSVFFSEQALILNAFPIAAIVGIFFSNQFADRNFAAERFLGFSQLVGGLAMLALGFTKAFWPFFGLMLVHCLFYVPTISISNQIAFAHLKDSRDFGFVRAGGTIGWILAAWPFFFIFGGLSVAEVKVASKWTYIVAGAASLLLAGWSLVLPHTPPKKAGVAGAEKLAWAEAFKLLKHPYVLVLWLVTFVDAFVHNTYFAWAAVFFGTPADTGGVGIAGKWIMPIMSLGQVAEILTMFFLGVTLKRLGYRTTMVLGILAYPIRFGVWAYFPHNEALIILVQVLHGVCYAFFFVSVYIFAEEYFPKDVRSSAQGLFNFMILGLGALVAYALGPKLRLEIFANNGVTDFHRMFLVPLVVAIVAALSLALFFRPPPKPPASPAIS
jgi:MFS family permease